MAVFAHYCGLDVGFSSANKIGLLSVNKLISDEQLGEERLESGNKLRSRGVQSVEIGLRLLVALAKAGGPMSLRDMSESAGMPPAKVHRYMVSLVETGMVDHRRSGTYELGRVAAEIGMESIMRVDLVNRAAQVLGEIVEDVHLPGFLSVWSRRGPTVVRWERGREPMAAVLGIGTVLPIASTCTGRAFAAHLPDSVVEPLLARETASRPITAAELRAGEEDLAIFRAGSAFQRGGEAIARPVFDYTGVAVAVMTLHAHRPEDIAPGSAAETALRAFR